MSPRQSWGARKSGRSYTDALRETLREEIDHAVVDAAGGEPDRVRDRPPRRVAVGDHGEPPQAEEVRAAVRVRIEARPEAAQRRPDEQPAEPPGKGCGDLAARRVEQLADRALEQLQRDVPREAVGDDHVGRAAQQLAALRVAEEVEAVALL